MPEANPLFPKKFCQERFGAILHLHTSTALWAVFVTGAHCFDVNDDGDRFRSIIRTVTKQMWMSVGTKSNDECDLVGRLRPEKSTSYAMPRDREYGRGTRVRAGRK